MSSRTPRAPEARALALLAVELVHRDPRHAHRLGLRALRAAHETGDRVSASTAERALGFACTELGDLPAAVEHLRRAVGLAESAGDTRRAAQARRTLTKALDEMGDPVGALREAERAATGLRGVELAGLRMMRSLVLERLGRDDEAMAGYAAALRVFRRTGSREMEARALGNRGLLLGTRGDARGAERDLVRAEALLVELGHRTNAAKVRHNLAIAAARAGDVPTALERLDRAQAQLDALGMGLDRAILPRDRCGVLLTARLLPEARAAAEEAVLRLGEVGATAHRAEALVLLSECLLVEGNAERAEGAAHEARRALDRQRRPAWAALARLAATRAAWASGDHSARRLAGARRARAALEANGFAAAATDAAVIAALMARDLGRSRIARAELARASGSRRRGTAELAARAWYAEALLRIDRGDRRGGWAALRAALRAVERSRATLGASELRAHAAGLGADAARLGLELAVERRSATLVLDWLERWRARGLAARPARTPGHRALAADLATLRGVTLQVEQAALDGRDTGALLRRQRELERLIVARTRRARPRGGAPRGATPGPAAIAAALRDRALVELFVSRGRLGAVVITARRRALRQLGAWPEIEAELEHLRFGLRRLALHQATASRLAATMGAVEHAASRLDALILSPLDDLVAERPLVVVPPGALHALPWAALPSCRGRAVQVSPSALLWHRAERRSRRGGEVVLIAGPGLPGARTEVTSLARVYPGSRRLTGRRATVAAVGSALEGAGLAHVAAHGEFRTDNPFFSALKLVDGPLTVHDFARLRRPPDRLILSACDTGLAAVHPGDELMGLAAALLGLGTRTIVASVGLAPDRMTRQLMVAMHRRLATGAGPAAALAAAQDGLAARTAEPGAAMAARAAFVCLGAGG